MIPLRQRSPEAGAPRPRSVPGFAIVLGFLLLLGMIASLHAPVGGTFDDLGGGMAPRPDVPDRCLALRGMAPDGYRWFPDTLRLTPVVQMRSEQHGTWYQATDRRRRGMAWQPAGMDSIDIAGHHTPVLRLPARGAHRVGRAGWPGHLNLWNAIISREWRVDAREIECSPQ